jgi:radical SAM/Cys-rich protein
MNAFDMKLVEHNCPSPKASRVSILVVHVGYKCNLRCTHCYVDSSPDRTEMMSLETMIKVLEVMQAHDEITTLDLTGGAPELNPHYRYFVKTASDMGKKVQVRSNLVIYSEPGMEDLPEFLAENKIKIFASLPHYEEEFTDKQRGKGSHKKSIAALKRLNELGYGKEGTGLELDIEFNPLRAALAPDQRTLTTIYRDRLMNMYGITFNKLIALSNAPLGRLRKLTPDGEFNKYMKELEGKFNPHTVEDLMCGYYLSISPSGRLYDCGFMQILDVPLKNGDMHIDNFDYNVLSGREIATQPVCFICTAGSGMNCFE